VQRGDTLWGIAQKFLKDPWRWPEIWRMNRDQVRNPHLIYPGDVIVLDRSDGRWRLTLERPLTRLSPTVRSSPLDAEAIPSIPAGEIEPYLTRPLITGPEGLVGAAEVVASRDFRAVRADGDIIYAAGMDPAGGDLWNIYRRGRTFTTSDGKEVLGVEQRYLGIAKVERFADPVAPPLDNAIQENVSTVRIVNAKEEIVNGDRLVPAPRGVLMSYVPHAPTRPIQAEIIATDRDAIEAGVAGSSPSTAARPTGSTSVPCSPSIAWCRSFPIRGSSSDLSTGRASSCRTVISRCPTSASASSSSFGFSTGFRTRSCSTRPIRSSSATTPAIPSRAVREARRHRMPPR
jgi:hypothetical protein